MSPDAAAHDRLLWLKDVRRDVGYGIRALVRTRGFTSVAMMLGIFATTGLVLVAFGIYGVLAYMVSQQTREIAIRMALGGERRDVMRMVLRFGLRLVAAGLVLGLAASVMTNRLLVTQLWNISAHDPVTFSSVAGVIVVIALLACWMPARRAVRVEPMVALRHE